MHCILFDHLLCREWKKEARLPKRARRFDMTTLPYLETTPLQIELNLARDDNRSCLSAV
jgi:hypothetical protein